MAIHSIVCKSCGANEFSEQNGLYVCKMCGTKHIISDDGNTVNIFVNGMPLTINEQYSAARAAYTHGNYLQALQLYTTLHKNYPMHWEPVYFIKLIHFLSFNSETDFKGQRESFVESLPALFELIKNNYDVLDRHSAIIELCSEFRFFCTKINYIFDERDYGLASVKADALTSKEEIAAEIQKQCRRRFEIIMLANDFRNFILTNFSQDRDIQSIAYQLIQYIVNEYVSYYCDFIKLQPDTEAFFWQGFELLGESDKNIIYRRYGVISNVDTGTATSNPTKTVPPIEDKWAPFKGMAVIFIIVMLINSCFSSR